MTVGEYDRVALAKEHGTLDIAQFPRVCCLRPLVEPDEGAGQGKVAETRDVALQYRHVELVVGTGGVRIGSRTVHFWHVVFGVVHAVLGIAGLDRVARVDGVTIVIGLLGVAGVAFSGAAIVVGVVVAAAAPLARGWSPTHGGSYWVWGTFQISRGQGVSVGFVCASVCDCSRETNNVRDMDGLEIRRCQ